MRLSRGKVIDGSLVCAYHGWQFQANGSGKSPGNPKLQPQAETMDVVEVGGVVWARRKCNEPSRLPELELNGYQLIHRAFRDIDAPFELVLDNFTEIEHTGVGHWQFGYDQARLGEIEFTLQSDVDGISGHAVGPQKPLQPLFAFTLGVRGGDRHTIEMRARYAPLHVLYDWWWEDPASGAPRGPRFKEIAFFAPLGPRRSRLVAFYYWDLPDRGRLGLNWLIRSLSATAIEYEISLDARLCSNVVDGAQTLEGCHLGRFDAMLRLHRRRLAEMTSEIRR
jgi:vanillate O-demethylase monooxygenase subunit